MSQDFTTEIMSSLVDDFTPLWELESLAKRTLPARSPSEQRRLLIANLESLWANGLLAFYRGTEFSGEEVEIKSADIRSELTNEDNWDWDRPRGPSTVQAVATGKGRVAYLTQTI